MGSLGFVLVEHVVPESRPRHVEGQYQVGRLQCIDGLEEHLREPVDAPDLFARAPDGEGVLDGVICAVNHGVSVKEHQKRGLFIRQFPLLSIGRCFCHATPHLWFRPG